LLGEASLRKVKARRGVAQAQERAGRRLRGDRKVGNLIVSYRRPEAIKPARSPLTPVKKGYVA